MGARWGTVGAHRAPIRRAALAISPRSHCVSFYMYAFIKLLTQPLQVFQHLRPFSCAAVSSTQTGRRAAPQARPTLSPKERSATPQLVLVQESDAVIITAA